jgi:hypothetical protein
VESTRKGVGRGGEHTGATDEVMCVPDDVTSACVVRTLEWMLTALPNSKNVLGASGSSLAKNTQALCVWGRGSGVGVGEEYV